MKRIYFSLVCLIVIASARADDIAFFEKTYKTKLTGIKPIGEYPDPDQYYSAIARQLGIPKLANNAVEKEFGWKQEEGKLIQSMVKRGSGTDRWEFMVVRVSIDPETKRPDTSTMEMKMVEIDDAGKKYFPEIPAAQRSVNAARLPKMTESILKNIRAAIDAYALDVGSTPERLEDLAVAPGDAKWKGPYWKAKGKITDPWGLEIFYKTTGKKVVLISSGPDRTMGTGDDIAHPKEASKPKPAKNAWTTAHNRWPLDREWRVPANQNLEVFFNEYTASEFKGSINRPNLLDWDYEDAFFKCGTEYKVEIRYKEKEWGRQVESRAYKDIAKINSVLELSDAQKDQVYEDAGAKMEASQDVQAFMGMFSGQMGVEIDAADDGMGDMMELAMMSESEGDFDQNEIVRGMQERRATRNAEKIERMEPLLDEQQLERYREHLHSPSPLLLQMLLGVESEPVLKDGKE